MKTFRRLVMTMVLGATLGARAEVEFAGYLANGGETKFTLADSASQATSEWLPIGASFGGYKIVSFDAKGEVLTVEKSGATSQLPLKATRVVAPAGGAAGAAAPSPAPTPVAVPVLEAAPSPLPAAPSETELAEARARATAAEARLQALLAQREKTLTDNAERRARMSQQAPIGKRIQAEEEKRAKEKQEAATAIAPVTKETASTIPSAPTP